MHTPGPWHSDDFEIYSENDPANLLAHVYAVDRPDGPDGDWEAGEQTRANMKLIKASPLLLAALKHMVACHYPDANGQIGAQEECWAAIQTAKSAIEAATGAA